MSEESATDARRLLLVSYWYPPAVGAAAERIHGFARHLPAYGWATEVLTSRPRENEPAGASEQNVHRVTDPRAGLLLGGTSQFANYGEREPLKLVSRFRMTLRGAMRDWIFPDRFRAWADAAQFEGEMGGARSQFDAILASFPPASAILAALNLHRRLGVPLFLDFRDRWFGPGGYEPKSPRARHAHEELEREAIRAARGFAVVSDAMADALAREHNVERGRIAVIPNGYESETESTRVDDPAGRTPLVVSHVGTVIARNRPDRFLNALSQLAKERRPSDVVFRFVGNLSLGYVRSLGLEGIVETTGLVPRAAAMHEMRSADALLLLVGDYVGRWGQNAKLFEYIRTGRPILCLEETPGSNDRRWLERFAPERSFFASIGNSNAIGDALEHLHEFLTRGDRRATPLSPEFQRFSRRSLAAELASRMNEWVRES